MATFTPIEFHRPRDFNKKLNDTFEFLRQNLRPLFKSILIIAGPPVLMGSLLMGSFMGRFLNLSTTVDGSESQTLLENYLLSPSLWLQLGAGFLFLLISSVVTIASINNYILLYGEKKSNQIEVDEVWGRVRQTFWMYLATLFLFSLLSMAVFLLLFLPVILLSAQSPWFTFFGIIGLMCALLYILFGASLTFFIRAYEHTGFFAALFRSFQLVRSKWWSTFGLIMVLMFIVYTISYLFIIPWYVVTMISTLHSVTTNALQEPSTGWKLLTIILFTLYYIAQMILSAIPHIGIAFQYFNLVELKEARGLLADIQSIGKAADDLPAREEHY